MKPEIPNVEVDYVLTGNPTKEELCRFFRQGDGEEYTVQAIKRHLRTEKQRQTLHEMDLSLEDVLNGRFTGTQEPVIQSMFDEWNAFLNKKTFGFSGLES
jgi:hypothetical protein